MIHLRGCWRTDRFNIEAKRLSKTTQLANELEEEKMSALIVEKHNRHRKASFNFRQTGEVA